MVLYFIAQKDSVSVRFNARNPIIVQCFRKACHDLFGLHPVIQVEEIDNGFGLTSLLPNPEQDLKDAMLRIVRLATGFINFQFYVSPNDLWKVHVQAQRDLIRCEEPPGLP